MHRFHNPCTFFHVFLKIYSRILASSTSHISGNLQPTMNSFLMFGKICFILGMSTGISFCWFWVRFVRPLDVCENFWDSEDFIEWISIKVDWNTTPKFEESNGTRKNALEFSWREECEFHFCLNWIFQWNTGPYTPLYKKLDLIWTST